MYGRHDRSCQQLETKFVVATGFIQLNNFIANILPYCEFLPLQSDTCLSSGETRDPIVSDTHSCQDAAYVKLDTQHSEVAKLSGVRLRTQKWTRSHGRLSSDSGLCRTCKCETARCTRPPRISAVEKADTLHMPSDKDSYASPVSSWGYCDKKNASCR